MEENNNNVENENKVSSNGFSEADKRDNKVMAVLSYVGILALIPYFVEKNSEYVRFHAIQGMNLLIIELIAGAIGLIPLVGNMVSWIIVLCTFVLSIIGIIDVLNEEAKELPFISSFKFIKK